MASNQHSEMTINDRDSRAFELIRDVDLPSIARATVAFLNSGGGTIVIGVNDDGSSGRLDDPYGAERAIADHLAVMVSPRADWSINTDRLAGSDVIHVYVPDGAAKPYAANGQILVRQGTSNRLAQSADLLRMLSARSTDEERWERRPALGLTVGDLDAAEVLRTARAARDRGLVGFDSEDLPEILDALHLVESGQLLNAAVVLFGKNPQRRFPQARVRVAHFASEDMTTFVDNRVLEGHVFSLIEQINAFFAANLAVGSSLHSAGYERKDKPAYPPYALREAVMNALVHRDYSAVDGGVSIAVFPDRLEIWNAGNLPQGLTPEELTESGVSRPHNPDIAHVFFLRGLIERWGIGTRRIAAECAGAGLPQPEWRALAGGIQLILRNKAKGVDSSTVLNHRQYAFLREMSEGAHIDVQDYWRRYASDMTERTARRDLAMLTELGYVVPVMRGARQVFARVGRDLPAGESGV